MCSLDLYRHRKVQNLPTLSFATFFHYLHTLRTLYVLFRSCCKDQGKGVSNRNVTEGRLGQALPTLQALVLKFRLP